MVLGDSEPIPGLGLALRHKGFRVLLQPARKNRTSSPAREKPHLRENMEVNSFWKDRRWVCERVSAYTRDRPKETCAIKSKLSTIPPGLGKILESYCFVKLSERCAVEPYAKPQTPVA